ncbi:MAG TPA: hypothetical protein VNO70_12330 [Blastocatellia bacterium]|nr:hypothetical protein [Blastocatellia bacterium]
MKKTRRDFLKEGITVTAAGIGAARFGMLKGVLAAARLQGKQPLTERNINALIPTDPVKYGDWIKGPTGDLKAWVKEKFQLTPEQEQALNALTPAQIAKIKDTLRQAAAKKAKVSVQFLQPPSGISARAHTTGTQQQTPTVTETKFEAGFTAVPPSFTLKFSCTRKTGAADK